MAKVKDVLPMVLAGLAGAASPQGAEVFTNIANTAHSRRQDEAAAVRRDDEMAMRKESHGAQMRLRDLAAADRDKKAEEEALDKVKLGQLGEYYSDQLIQEFGEDNPIIQPALGLLTEGGTDKQTLKNIYDTLSGRARKEQEEAEAPTTEQTLKTIQDAIGNGLTARGEIDGVTVQGAPPTEPTVKAPNTSKMYDGALATNKEIMKVRGEIADIQAESAQQQAERGESAPDGTQGRAENARAKSVMAKTNELLPMQGALIQELQAIASTSANPEEAFSRLIYEYRYALEGYEGFDPKQLEGGGAAPEAQPEPAGESPAQKAFRQSTRPLTPTPTPTPTP